MTKPRRHGERARVARHQLRRSTEAVGGVTHLHVVHRRDRQARLRAVAQLLTRLRRRRAVAQLSTRRNVTVGWRTDLIRLARRDAVGRRARLPLVARRGWRLRAVVSLRDFTPVSALLDADVVVVVIRTHDRAVGVVVATADRELTVVVDVPVNFHVAASIRRRRARRHLAATRWSRRGRRNGSDVTPGRPPHLLGVVLDEGLALVPDDAVNDVPTVVLHERPVVGALAVLLRVGRRGLLRLVDEDVDRAIGVRNADLGTRLDHLGRRLALLRLPDLALGGLDDHREHALVSMGVETAVRSVGAPVARRVVVEHEALGGLLEDDPWGLQERHDRLVLVHEALRDQLLLHAGKELLAFLGLVVRDRLLLVGETGTAVRGRGTCESQHRHEGDEGQDDGTRDARHQGSSIRGGVGQEDLPGHLGAPHHVGHVAFPFNVQGSLAA